MTSEQTQRLIERLMNVFPSFGAWVERHSGQLRDVWREVLSPTNFDDASVVVEKLVCGDLEMPANYEFDRMAILIRRESRKITSERRERNSQHEKYFASKSFDFVRRDKTGHFAVAIGEMRKRHEITFEENDQMMKELLAWDKGGDFPLWMTELFKVKENCQSGEREVVDV